ncbi:MAG TPA: ATP-binding domain-containing protein [Acidimicrobiales bacterium]|nr:ATP-binding domain-containing protein [Acidimicrobiales bacterium]
MDASVEPDSDLEAEQAYIDHAYECMSRMRKRAKEVRTTANAPAVHRDIVEYELERRLGSLTGDGSALCFGRIDATAGERWYVGRRHVEDATGTPVVVEWRAPVAVPFYRASHVKPMGLARRRQFTVEGQHLLDFSDEFFAASPEAGGEGPQIRGRDALLRELDRDRTGTMRDIVATIQAEQDEIIRRPVAGITLVQGGPGTGKTAVGLHRAAFLLYDDEVLERAGVLVVGPNRTFLRYISQVLPSLDVTAVGQLTIRDLVRGVRLRAIDSPAAARVKGDPRMAEVLRRAVAAHRRPLEHDIELVFEDRRRVTLTAAWVNAEVARLSGGTMPYNPGRPALRDRMLREADRLYRDKLGPASVQPDARVVAQQVRGQRTFQAALDRLWPALDVDRVLSEVFTDRRVLSEASRGVLDEPEVQLVWRADVDAWTEADIPLVDETRFLLEGRPPAWGHIVVDECQDLSPMALRMLERRCPSGSMTILGDIAQGTSVWAPDSWDEVLAHLPTHAGVHRSELAIGYRAPSQIIELASRLLRVAAPHLRPVESVRPGETDPHHVSVSRPEDLPTWVATEASELATRHRSVAVVSPDSLVRVVREALSKRSGIDLGDAATDGLDHRVTLVAAREAKGLEFDAVIVVEPAAIAAEIPAPFTSQGLRLLYVCLTRATKHLSVIHHRALPDAMRESAD